MDKRLLILLHLIISIILSSCSFIWGSSNDISSGTGWTETPTPFLPEYFLALAQSPSGATSINSYPGATSTINLDKEIWVSPAVPTNLTNYLTKGGFQISNDQQKSKYQFIAQPTGSTSKSTWIYALVAPFPTSTDDVKWMDLQAIWRGETSSAISGLLIWMDAGTLEAMSSLLGSPAANIVRITSTEKLIEAAWTSRPSWAIVPFESLQPSWKVLKIDGQFPISNKFNIDGYPLKVFFGFSKGKTPSDIVLPVSNRDPKKISVLAMTGVTAFVRATAAKMEKKGVLYPGEGIRDWLLEADLTHISNEIPFSEDCPYPNPNQETLVFCSDPKYISLLEDIGTDIVELTGNHFQDWGSAATLFTIDMYKQRNWLYFGGGIDNNDARAAKTIINNGNKFAFIGCNPAGPSFAWATDYQPGAASCDYAWMQSEISRLRSEDYLPVVTFQYNESYSVYPLPDQIQVFQSMVNAGAVIVSGSQAHFPQTMEIFNGSFIHYGLGNLFFDQMDYPVVGTRREFIDRHVFYDGIYISTELLTSMLEDYSRPRPMTQEERSIFLEEIFKASGW
jgi:hypothetical protein